MVINITGVLESGANRGRKVPDNPRHTLAITQTEDVTVRLTVYDADGVPLDLTTLAGILVLSVKHRPTDEPPIISRLGVISPLEGIGVALFQIASVDTKFVEPRRYIYDVWLIQPSGARDPVVPLSPFLIEPTVGKPGATVTTPPPVPIEFMSPSTHEALRQLIHFINTGPAKGFITGAYREILPTGNPFPTSVTWWESSAKVKKIVEKFITRNPNQTPSIITWNMYGTDGVTIVESTTDVISYSGVFETTRTRAIA